MDSSTSSGQATEEIVEDLEILEITRLKKKHEIYLEGLWLTKHPFETLKCFTLAILQYLKKIATYAMTRGWLFLLATLLTAALGVILLTVKGPHEKHVDEVLRYIRFGLWWIGLGVASSIGLGSGLHTFVMYLGPHIAFFTLTATQCGRVDLKAAPYDTKLLSVDPSWTDKPCEDFGPPLFPMLANSGRYMVPLLSILPQLQLEAVLWGVGTALGELPPYFVSRAAHLSGNNLQTLEGLKASVDEGSHTLSIWLNRLKRLVFSQAQHLNFFTILVLASVPNPLFDLAGMMCGQFMVPFWKFFTATLLGKAIIKTHIQTVFIILVCNNQLIEWMENEFVWILEHIPGLSRILPHLLQKLHTAREKFNLQPISPPKESKGKRWNFSISSIWNSIVWLVLIGYFNKIITATAQSFVKEKQQQEIALISERLSEKPKEKLMSANGTAGLKSD